MTDFFYYSGIVVWLLLAAGGVLAFADLLIDWTVMSLWTKREFLAFVMVTNGARATTQQEK